jgi:hypothetical protein
LSSLVGGAQAGCREDQREEGEGQLQPGFVEWDGGMMGHRSNIEISARLELCRAGMEYVVLIVELFVCLRPGIVSIARMRTGPKGREKDYSDKVHV